MDQHLCKTYSQQNSFLVKDDETKIDGENPVLRGTLHQNRRWHFNLLLYASFPSFSETNLVFKTNLVSVK